MPNIFFTSDHHFGHKNIIKFCKRPFSDEKEMDAEMIRLWNAKVSGVDLVYHLGDFTLLNGKKAQSYFAQLNGTIRLLGCSWHHDHKWLPKQFGPSDFTTANGNPVEIMPPMVVLEFPEFGDGKHPKALVLCHYPLAEWDRKHHGSWHLFGHCHGNHSNIGQSFDVGVDSNQFSPLGLREVAERIGKINNAN